MSRNIVIVLYICVLTLKSFAYGYSIPDAIRADDLLTDFYLDDIKTSSELKNVVKYEYAGWRAVDGDKNSAWVPGINSGIGEWIEFRGVIESSDTPIIMITLLPGIARNDKLFKENNRPKCIRIDTINVATAKILTSYDFTLEDENKLQVIFLPNEQDFFKKEYFDKHYSTLGVAIRITIISIYSGTKYNDTGISEIEMCNGEGKKFFETRRNMLRGEHVQSFGGKTGRGK